MREDSQALGEDPGDAWIPYFMTIALILAAGSGERLGADRPKALVELGGLPLLQWSVDALRAVPAIEQIVVALPAGADAPVGTSGIGAAECARSLCASRSPRQEAGGTGIWCWSTTRPVPW